MLPTIRHVLPQRIVVKDVRYSESLLLYDVCILKHFSACVCAQKYQILRPTLMIDTRIEGFPFLYICNFGWFILDRLKHRALNSDTFTSFKQDLFQVSSTHFFAHEVHSMTVLHNAAAPRVRAARSTKLMYKARQNKMQHGQHFVLPVIIHKLDLLSVFMAAQFG